MAAKKRTIVKKAKSVQRAPSAKKTFKKVTKKPSSPFVKAKAAGNAKQKADPRTGKVMVAKRSDLGQPGSVAIDRLPEPHRTIARAADAMICNTVKGATSVVKWGNACYYQDGRAFATLYQTKRGVNLGIPGAMIDDPERLLEGEGKSMRHIKLHDEKLAGSAAVARLVGQAVEIGFDRM